MDQATPSTASDGARAPLEIVELTLDRGHSTIAISKRDTPSSMREVRKGAGRGTLEVIPDGDVVAAWAVGRVQGRCASPENTAMRGWLWPNYLARPSELPGLWRLTGLGLPAE